MRKYIETSSSLPVVIVFGLGLFYHYFSYTQIDFLQSTKKAKANNCINCDRNEPSHRFESDTKKFLVRTASEFASEKNVQNTTQPTEESGSPSDKTH